MIVAVHYETGKWVNPKPNTGERDRAGHFIGCEYYGCAAMNCRERFTDEVVTRCAAKEFLWKRV